MLTFLGHADQTQYSFFFLRVGEIDLYFYRGRQRIIGISFRSTGIRSIEELTSLPPAAVSMEPAHVPTLPRTFLTATMRIIERT